LSTILFINNLLDEKEKIPCPLFSTRPGLPLTCCLVGRYEQKSLNHRNFDVFAAKVFHILYSLRVIQIKYETTKAMNNY